MKCAMRCCGRPEYPARYGLAILLVVPLASGLFAEAETTLGLCRAMDPEGTASWQSHHYLSDSIREHLVVRPGRVTPDGCDTITLRLKPDDILWAKPVAPETQVHAVRHISLQGRFGKAPRVSEVHFALRGVPLAGAQTADPVDVPDGGREPDARIDSARNPARSAWIWDPATWRNKPEALWRLASDYGIGTLFVTVPVTGGTVGNPEALAAFIEASGGRGIRVWAVIGDPRDVLKENLPALLKRIRAYRQYNAGAPEAQRLGGVQLDIEPYLLPGYEIDPAHWRERYLGTVGRAAETMDGAMPLDLVVPVWWGEHAAWGRPFLDALSGLDISMTVMNYRTDPERLQAGATPFLRWGRASGKRVRMALETGHLPDESRRYYASSPENAGELRLLRVGERPVLLLLRLVETGLPGQAFRFTDEVMAPSSNLTFRHDLMCFREVAERMEKRWSEWSCFAGIAIHGLDQHMDAP